MTSPTSLLGTLLQQLADDELLAAGPDLVAGIQAIGASSDPVSQYLLVRKLGATLLADQVTVKQEAIGQILTVVVGAISGAIAVAQARQSANPAASPAVGAATAGKS
jgi:hypothetical protein